MTRRARRLRVWDVLFGAVVLCIAYGLKRHYSLASASDLAWVLGPTATVATALTGDAFVAEQGVGYIATDLRTAIVPACAGVNFLIAALCTLGFGFVGAMGTARAKALWLPTAAVLSYVTTVVVNGARVALGIAVHRSRFLDGWLSPGEAHRVLGIAVYLVALWGLFAVVGAFVERAAREQTS